MKKSYFILLLIILSYSIKAQVGINTNNPKSTLQVQKRTELIFPDGIIPPRISGDSLRMKESAYGAAQNGAIVYVTSPATTTGPKTTGVITTGLFVYDAFATNSGGTSGQWAVLPTATTPSTGIGDGAYSAKFTSDFSLLGLTLGAAGQRLLSLSANTSSGSTGNTSVQVPSAAMNAGVYTVPSTGIYQINYSYKEGSGANVAVLTNSGIVITRTPFGSSTPVNLDTKTFGGVNVALVLTVSITQTQISHLYSLTAGDKLQFGINRTAVAALDVTNVIEADISIHRVK